MECSKHPSWQHRLLVSTFTSAALSASVPTTLPTRPALLYENKHQEIYQHLIIFLPTVIAVAILLLNLNFSVTFVRSEGEYWTKVASRPVWDGMSRLPTTRAPEKVTDPPAFSPAIRNDGCGTNKGCIEECEV